MRILFFYMKYNINSLTQLGCAQTSKPLSAIDGGAVMDRHLEAHVQADSI